MKEQQNFNVKINMIIYEILERDREIFKIKSKNQLINKIFYAYLNSSEEEDIYKNIEKKLLNSKNIKKISDKLLLEIKDIIRKEIYPSVELKRKKRFNEKKENHQLNFRLDKINENNSIKEMGQGYNSIFFRQIFEWYSKKSKYKREELLYHDNLNKLKEAIEKNKIIQITTKKIDGEVSKFNCFPYSIIVPKEENYNYLLITNEKKEINTTRISNIENIIVLNETFKIEKDIEKKLNEKVKFRNINKGDFLKVKVRLNQEGFNKYNRIIHNRPELLENKEILEEKIEDKINYIIEFKTVPDRIKYYFSQFGNECEILEPEIIRNEMKNFYLKAYQFYSENF